MCPNIIPASRTGRKGLTLTSNLFASSPIFSLTNEWQKQDNTHVLYYAQLYYHLSYITLWVKRDMTKSKSSQSRGSGRRAKRKSAVSLRPEHQRELFALALIAIAGVTIIFYLTGITGQLSTGWKSFIEKLLGWGALVVPLVVGVLGIALFQSGQNDKNPLHPTQIIGTVVVVLALLMLLEFGIPLAKVMPTQKAREAGLSAMCCWRFLAMPLAALPVLPSPGVGCPGRYHA
jgi:hypothetical protein